MQIQSVTVRYFACWGERRCDVTGHITPELAKRWEADGWRIVTESTNREVPIYGELTEVILF